MLFVSEGVYTVTITAINHNLREINTSIVIHVLHQPQGLELQVANTCILFGDKVFVNASLRRGTNVSFTWKFDDETELINAGRISHHNVLDRSLISLKRTARIMKLKYETN